MWWGACGLKSADRVCARAYLKTWYVCMIVNASHTRTHIPRVCVCMCMRVCVCSARTRQPARLRVRSAVPQSGGAPYRRPAPLQLVRAQRFYRNRSSTQAPPPEAPERACPVEVASLTPVWVSSKWHAGLGSDPNELSRVFVCRGRRRRRPPGLETPPGEPPAGTMLACLTRGNLLDVLQEGFNEVTAPPTP